MKEIESKYWDDQSKRFLKIKLHTLFNSENKIICSKDGQILRMILFLMGKILQIQIKLNTLDGLENVEKKMIKQAIGRQFGKKKFCPMLEVITPKMDKNKVFGKIQQQRIGVNPRYMRLENIRMVSKQEGGNSFMTVKRCNEIKEIFRGGGSYNFQGQKGGKWFELSDNFWNKSQLMYYGEYFNGKKVGLWDILYKSKNDNNLFKIVGCGTYVQEKQNESIQINIKQGKWIEQNDQFWEYNSFQNLVKVKLFTLVFTKMEEKLVIGIFYTNPINYIQIMYKCKRISQLFKSRGGGQYELKEGDNGFYDQMKSGSWIELNDGFGELRQIIHTGFYKNGKKDGYWDVLFKSIETNQFKKIGGGQYMNEGQKDSVKVGDWIEQCSKFNLFNQLTYNGKYRDGKKVDRWDAFFKQQGENNKFNLIGGGVYSSTIVNDSTVKNGRWIEMNDTLWEQSLVTLEGEYQNGIKVGIWKSYFKDVIAQKKEQMQDGYLLCFLTRGGGEYIIERDGDSQKTGRWIELSSGFRWSDQVTFNGQYLNGKKFGKWDMFNKNGGLQKSQFECIGGGSYDIKQINSVLSISIKSGYWIEFEDKFWHQSEILFVGEYINGLKVGEWKIQYKDVLTKKISIIGGGSYKIIQQNNGFEISIKSGVWIELAQEFTYNNQKVYLGEYINGKKTGKWDKMDIKGNGVRKMQNQS
ncbi:unnamed protein product (macronuclear) [Paramecium tetraurelia]|uniref:Uncharacterized protein n=1 Tax=Paramecium tetraurelia TaxID=5888 RepID=A0DA28_PARTE|nr:uncharacterized protein GSPATT00014827001 [Paramecium tetraurelia]CAK79895.1 unnamed protein product [Paramecium tetraurelia]|eukprot:XP_001447292.1 hypothetical protein (macronuclear) [Paramecium tetraurelia strain d4-2]